MIKTATASILRKLKARWLQGSLFLLGLSVSYILLVNGIFYHDFSLVAFSLTLIAALHLGEQPLTSVNEIKLHKIFGASRKSIWPLILSQSFIKAILITILALALAGVSQIDKIIPLSSLFDLSHIWIVPLVTLLFFLVLALLHFRLFNKTTASLSMK